MITISELDLMVWFSTLYNEFKWLLIQKLRSKMAKAKIATITIMKNTPNTKADNLS